MEKMAVGKILGPILGDVVGDVKLVPGKRGNALYTNGIDQRVNLGNQRDSCMGDLSKCNNGFVMAMWLQVHKYTEPDEPGFKTTEEYYISSGGHTSHSMGVALLMRAKKIRVIFRTETHLWDFSHNEILSLHTWYHLVLTWDVGSGGKVYINGVLGSHNQVGRSFASNRLGNTYADFMLGDRNHEPPGYPGEMTLDELRIWDAVMNETDVWNIYAADIFL